MYSGYLEVTWLKPGQTDPGKSWRNGNFYLGWFGNDHRTCSTWTARR